jgi:NAD(P)-dependent dehydrogenase (short-subunit alcohol dehydrogenase family)
VPLAGKRVLVTGGGSGIGAAIVRRFLAAGATVTAMGRRPGPLAEGGARPLVGDVTREEDRRRAVEQAGPLDVLVNNAGVGGAWDGAIATNLEAPYRLSLLAAGDLGARRGCIVNVSSLSGLRAAAGSVPYCTAKAGLNMITQALAVDLGPRGVRVNAVCPAWIRTSMADEAMAQLDDDLDAAYAQANRHVPLRRAGLPDEVAAAALFLASDDASYITGALLTVDGGASVVDAASIAFDR